LDEIQRCKFWNRIQGEGGTSSDKKVAKEIKKNDVTDFRGHFSYNDENFNLGLVDSVNVWRIEHYGVVP